MKHIKRLLVIAVAMASIGGVSAIAATATSTAQAPRADAAFALPMACGNGVGANGPGVVYGAWVVSTVDCIGFPGGPGSTQLYAVCTQFLAGIWGWVNDSGYGYAQNQYGTDCSNVDSGYSPAVWLGSLGNCQTGDIRYRNVYNIGGSYEVWDTGFHANC